MLPERRGVIYVAHGGASMVPVLPDPCVLEVRPYGGRRPRPGDVICFAAEEGLARAHRVLRLTGQGMVTKGDGSAREDERRVQVEEVHGRVVARWVGSRRRAVLGGRPGLVTAGVVRLGRLASSTLAGSLGSLGRVRKRSARVLRPLASALRPRVVSFVVAGQVRWKLLLWRREIGRYDEGRGGWILRQPYRLLLDRAGLPAPGGAARGDGPASGRP